MKFELSEKEIGLIALAFDAAQFIDLLPPVHEHADLKTLLDKLGIRYDADGMVLSEEYDE